MSSALEMPRMADVPRMPIPIPQRGTYIPEWAPEWKERDMELPVCHGQDVMGFMVGHVLPERRWALRKEGEVARTLPQSEFETLYRRWIAFHYNPGKGIVEALPTMDVNVEPIPCVERFINYAVDEDGRGHTIGWNPYPDPELAAAPVDPEADRAAREEIIKANESRADVAPVPDAPAMAPALCGKEVKRQHVMQHQAHCKKCHSIKGRL